LNTLEILKTVLGIVVFAGIVYACTKSLTRLFQVAAGQAIFGLYNIIFDFCLWPIIQDKFGVYGAVGLTLLATVMNLCVLMWYQKTCKTDWLGIDIVHDIVAKAEHIRTVKHTYHGIRKFLFLIHKSVFLLSACLIKGVWIPILYISLFHDSFLATAYYVNWKHHTVNVKLVKDDYIVFLTSTLISCIGWSIFTEMITLPAFKTLWQTFAG
jgi:hypothetical protein